MLKYNILKNLGIQGKGWDVTDIKTYKGATYYYISEVDGEHVCRICSQVHSKSHDKRTLHLTDWSYGANKTFLNIKYSRINCDCVNYKHRKEAFPFQGRYSRLTRRYETFVYYLLKKHMMTVSDVMRLTGLSYQTVYNIDINGMTEDLQIEPIGKLRAIGVDEVSFQKGHKYVTVISDLNKHGVVYVTEDNNKASLEEFFNLIGEEACKNIEIAVSDFHKPYLETFSKYIPKATVVGDRFHVAKMLNGGIDKIRKRLLEPEKNTKGRKKSKKAKVSRSKLWVLRYRKKNLNEKHLETLAEIKKTNEPLYEAYILKEKFMEFFNIKDNKEGEDFLASWAVEAFKSGHEEFIEFAEFIVRKKEYLLNYFKSDVAMGFCEGMNTTIKVIKRMGYGYRNIDVFKKKIRQRCSPFRKDAIPEFYQFADQRLKQMRKMNIQIHNLY